MNFWSTQEENIPFNAQPTDPLPETAPQGWDRLMGDVVIEFHYDYGWSVEKLSSLLDLDVAHVERLLKAARAA